MSVDITFSKAIKLADVKKIKNLKVGRKQHLYGALGVPTFKISHKDFPKEYIYVIYDRWRNNSGEIIQDIPDYKTETKDLMNFKFNFVDTYGGYYHILYELYKAFDLKFAYNLDPRDTNPEFSAPMEPEEYDKLKNSIPEMVLTDTGAKILDCASFEKLFNN